MTGMVEWLRAQLDAEERTAIAASSDRGGTTPDGENWRWECSNCDTVIDITPVTLLDEFLECPACEWVSVALRSVQEYPTNSGRPLPHFVVSGDEVRPVDALYLALHAPARVLAEVAAKRAILGEIENAYGHCGGAGSEADDDVICSPADTDRIVRLMLVPYADRPGFREEWRA